MSNYINENTFDLIRSISYSWAFHGAFDWVST